MEPIIIYGAGEAGRSLYDFLKNKAVENVIYCFVDKNADNIKNIDDIPVLKFEETLEMEYKYFVSIVKNEAKNVVENMLKKAGKEYTDDYNLFAKLCGMDLVTFNREFISFHHIEGMDSYFETAEKKGALDVFWSDESCIYNMFKKLNLENVVELACGRGRHVDKYISSAKNVTLVDILNKNIEYCRDRFKEYSNISYVCNNGYNLEDLPDDSYTALFSYDAVVHFEMMDIASYLKDFYRILKKDSYALIHHSNYTGDYKASYETSPGGRSYMSAEIFAYLAHRNGFQVVEQNIMDWVVKDLDCVTLLKKI